MLLRATLSSKRVKELKSELEARNVSCAGIVEKFELVELLAQNWETPPRPTRTATTTSGSWRASGRCPFEGSSSTGYTTEQGRIDWLDAHGINGAEAARISADVTPSASLSERLHFWQLHALLGPRAITSFVRRFYERVLNDRTPGSIATAFTRIADLDHHVATQAAFWIDAFGGGRRYHGGDYRLNFHHENNAASVMNAQGASRWMLHMGNTLCEPQSNWRSIDPRVKPCIVDFLRVKVQKYSSASRSTKYAQWRFDESDFYFVGRDPEMIALYQAQEGEGEGEEGDREAAAAASSMLTKEDRATLMIALASADTLPRFRVRELRRFLSERGVDSSACVEKSEMLTLALSVL